MVITMLAGGLGNQLFQYAFGFRVASQLQTDLKLDTHLLESRLLARLRSYTPRSYELGPFAINHAIASAADVAECLLKTVLMPGKRAILLREQSYAGQHPDLLTPHTRDAFCLGYWQSEAYFKPVEIPLRQQLIFRKEPSDHTQRLIIQLQSFANPVFVHIRRGDYITNAKASAYHGFCGEAYYLDALSYVRTQVETPHFFVFSDDMSWVKHHLGDFLQPVTFVEGNTGTNGWEDMYLMSLCRHGIIANSSFSWWGAWLNPDPKRLVIAPRRWFKSDNVVNEVIVPAHWHTL